MWYFNLPTISRSWNCRQVVKNGWANAERDKSWNKIFTNHTICNIKLQVIQWNEIWNLLFIWLWEGSDPWYGSEIFKWYHCYICNIILQVIQWNVTWNIIHIYLIHEKKDLIRGMAAKSSNEILRINHCYICSMVLPWLIHVSKLAYDFKMAHSCFKSCLQFQDNWDND